MAVPTMATQNNVVNNTPVNDGLTSTTQPLESAVNVIDNSKNRQPTITAIDIFALTITFVLMAGVIAIMVYAFRRRCDGRKNACEACRARQRRSPREREDDLEDVELLWDGKGAVGKQD